MDKQIIRKSLILISLASDIVGESFDTFSEMCEEFGRKLCLDEKISFKPRGVITSKESKPIHCYDYKFNNEIDIYLYNITDKDERRVVAGVKIGPHTTYLNENIKNVVKSAVI